MNPSAQVPISAATASARASGDASAVPSKNRSTCGHIGDRREARPERVGADDLGHLLRALGGGSRAFGGGFVRGCDADTTVRDHADTQAGVLSCGALVDLALGEPGQAAPFVHEQDLDAVDAGQFERSVGDVAEPVGTDQARHQRTPTWTLRNRAGDAPWPTRPT